MLCESIPEPHNVSIHTHTKMIYFYLSSNRNIVTSTKSMESMESMESIGFRNGVYDLKDNRFMPHSEDDNTHLTHKMHKIPIDYVDLNENDQAVKDVHDFLVKIFPDTAIRNYFLDISSELFVGGNKRNHIYFWLGKGCNGKSMTQLLFENMLGPYAIKWPSFLIVGKSKHASHALARAGNRIRFAVIQEVDEKDVLNVAVMKQMTGDDTMIVRGLYEDKREIAPKFDMAIVCNHLPSIPKDSKDDVWNRIRVIPFESTFTDNAPASEDEQLMKKHFPKDPHFAEKIPKMSQAFAWVLLNHRKKNPNYEEPEKVKYFRENMY